MGLKADGLHRRIPRRRLVDLEVQRSFPYEPWGKKNKTINYKSRKESFNAVAALALDPQDIIGVLG